MVMASATPVVPTKPPMITWLTPPANASKGHRGHITASREVYGAMETIGEVCDGHSPTLQRGGESSEKMLQPLVVGKVVWLFLSSDALLRVKRRSN